MCQLHFPHTVSITLSTLQWVDGTRPAINNTEIDEELPNFSYYKLISEYLSILAYLNQKKDRLRPKWTIFINFLVQMLHFMYLLFLTMIIKNILSILGYFTQNGRIFPPNGPKLNFIVDLSLYYLSRDSTQGTILPASDRKNTQSLHVRNHKIHFLPPHDL